MSRTFKAALFDLDGTLIDTEDQYTEFWSRIGHEYLPEIDRFAYIIKGTTMKQTFDRYFPDPKIAGEIWPQLDAFEANMRYTLYPGAEKFIRNLKKHGIKLALVTSSNDQKLSQVKQQIPEIEELFDRLLTSEDFKASKPDPYCYKLGAQVFSLNPEECVVFEDAFTGLDAGMASGCYTIGLSMCNPAELIKDRCHTVWDGWENKTYESVIELL